MASANFQLQDNFQVPYAIFEADADQNVEAPGAGDSVVVTSSDVASLTVVPDTTVDPAKVPTGANPAFALQTGLLVGGAKIQAGVQVTATFAHADGSQAPPPVVDLIDIVGGAVTTGSISLGTPVVQGTAPATPATPATPTPAASASVRK
jgi:hypothetical protein